MQRLPGLLAGGWGQYPPASLHARLEMIMAEQPEGNPQVEPLDVDDPLNRALGAIQFAINNTAQVCWEFVEDFLRAAFKRKAYGVLDLKMAIHGDKLILRRAFRRVNEAPPQGRWWSLPVTSEVLHEYFERIAPPQAEAQNPLDVDASAPAAPPTFSAAALLRAREREASTLIGNIKRTKDEITANGVEVYLGDVDHALGALREALDTAVGEIKAREGEQ
jgi:hypothetical protein